MSGCERGWPGYPHCVYPPPPQPHHHHHQPQWPHHHHHHHHHHHLPAVDYCGGVTQPPHHHPVPHQQPPYVGYGDHAGSYMGAVFPSCPPHYWDGDDLVDAYGRVVKRRSSANKKERRRTQSINNAFAELRDCIPNVPADTKLSKIKTLRLATSYIAYLMGVLRADAHDAPAEAFKAELPPKSKTHAAVHTDHDKDDSDMEAEESIFSPSYPPSESPLLPEVSSSVAAPPTTSPSSSSSSSSPAVYYSSPSSLLSLSSTMDQSKPGGASRTGWPESVWARELRF